MSRPLVKLEGLTTWFPIKRGLFQRTTGWVRAVDGIDLTIPEGQTVALLEDTVTTGGSTLEALDAVEAEGGKVVRVLCLVDRGEGAAAAFSERGIQLESIYDRKDLPV